jgi:hypothetical protein
MEVAMSNTVWNEIVDAYDEHFSTLEAARSEYSDAIDKIFNKLARSFQSDFAGNVEVKHSIEDMGGEFGKRVFRSTIRVANVQWCRVLARLGGPWSDDQRFAGQLHIAIEYAMEEYNGSIPSFITFDREQLSGSFTQMVGVLQPQENVKLYPNEQSERWIYFEAIGLRQSDVVDVIIRKYKQFIEFAKTFAISSRDQASPILKAYIALKMCLSQIMKNPIAQETIEPTSLEEVLWEWKKDVRHIQASFPDLPPDTWIAVGVYLPRRELIYGHNEEADGIANISQVFSKKIGTHPFTYDGSPAGTLLDAAALESLSEERICKKVFETIRLFYSTCLEIKNGTIEK